MILMIFLSIFSCAFAADSLTPPLNTFTAGQVTPHIEGRTDFPLYPSAMRQAENMIPKVVGSIQKRPGTVFAADFDPVAFFPDYRLTYVSENGAIYGLHISSSNVVQTLDAVSNVDNGDGTVSWKFTGHELEDGWVVYLTGVAGQTGPYTCAAGTTGTDWVVLTMAYSNYTPNGDETILRYFDMTASYGSCVQDSDGNVYFGSNETPSGTYVTKIEQDGTQSDMTDPIWPHSNAYTITDLDVLRGDPDYLYGVLEWSTANFWYKWDLDTGTRLWKYYENNPGVPDIAVRANGDLFTGGFGTRVTYDLRDRTGPKVINGDTGLLKENRSVPRMRTVYHTHIDENMDMLIIAGRDWYNSTIPETIQGWNVQATDLDGSNWRGIRFGGITYDGFGGTSWETDYTISKGEVITYEGNIYVCVRPEEKLYKLDSDFNILGTCDVPYICGFWADIWGNIVCASASNVATPDYDMTWVDPDTMTVIATNDYGLFSPLDIFDSWIAPVGGNYIQGNAFFWPGIEVQQVETPPGGAAPDSVRLVPFVFNQDDAYVLSFEPERLGFQRTVSGVSGRIQAP
jgi:hypothetical protein